MTPNTETTNTPTDAAEFPRLNDLFMDKQLTVAWWNSLDFLPDELRYRIAISALNQCEQGTETHALFRNIVDSLALVYGDLSTWDILSNKVQMLWGQHRLFSILALASIGFLAIKAGIAASNLFR